MRGMMEALLDDQRPLVAAPPPYPEAHPVDPPEELEFPSVSRIEGDIFGETPPSMLSEAQLAGSMEQKKNLDKALETISAIRKQREQDARPDVQPGPGEKEVAEWLRIPPS